MDSFTRVSNIDTLSTPHRPAAGELSSFARGAHHIDDESNDALASFRYAVPNKGTREQYFFMLGYFLKFLGIPGNNLADRAATYLARAGNDHKWTYDSLIKYISHLNDLPEDKKLSGGTVGTCFLCC